MQEAEGLAIAGSPPKDFPVVPKHTSSTDSRLVQQEKHQDSRETNLIGLAAQSWLPKELLPVGHFLYGHVLWARRLFKAVPLQLLW